MQLYASSPEGLRLNVHVDETGTAELDLQKLGVGRYYVAAAVCVSEEHDATEQRRVDDIGARLRGGAVIETSKTGTDHDCRLWFLEEGDDVLRAIVSTFTDAQVLPRSGTEAGTAWVSSEQAENAEQRMWQRGSRDADCMIGCNEMGAGPRGESP